MCPTSMLYLFGRVGPCVRPRCCMSFWRENHLRSFSLTPSRCLVGVLALVLIPKKEVPQLKRAVQKFSSNGQNLFSVKLQGPSEERNPKIRYLKCFQCCRLGVQSGHTACSMCGACCSSVCRSCRESIDHLLVPHHTFRWNLHT